MWYATPRGSSSSSRFLELVPDAGTVIGDGASLSNGIYNVPGTGTLRPRFPFVCGAFHALVSPTQAATNMETEIFLGSRYGLNVRVQPFPVPGGFNGDTIVLGDGGSGSYWEIAIRDNQTDVASLACPMVVSVFSTLDGTLPTRTTQGIAIGFGYVLDESGPFAYAFCSNENDSGFGPSVQNRRGLFGSRSYFLRHPVDESDIEGPLVITGTRLRFATAAAHDGPLTSHYIHKPESTAVKRARQGTTTASLRSRAINFTSPHGTSRGGLPSRIPIIDWGEPDPSDDLAGAQAVALRFLCAYGSHIYNSVAFVKPDVPWNSNVSAHESQNETLARLRVTLKDGTYISVSQSLWALPEIVWDATSDGQGNNEYVGYRNESAVAERVGESFQEKTFERQNVFASVSLREDFTNHFSNDFDDVDLVSTYEASVTIFLRDNSFSGESAIRRLEIRRVLTAQEGEDLLAGQIVDLGIPLSLGPGGITIQGIGPA
jgi:hypothetical protein